MKILFTGATGFIGTNLTQSLSKKHELFALVRKSATIVNIENFTTILKYESNTDLQKIFEQYHFDGVVHLASLYLRHHHIEDIDLLIDSNVAFGTKILEACKQNGVKWFLNTGTFWQHYNNEKYNPVNLYAATKEAFEKMAKYYTETSNLIFVTLKLNDTFGPNDTREKIFNLWDKIAKTGETLDMSDGEQIMDICYIDDVVNAYDILINHLSSNDAYKLKNKTFAVKSKERVSLKELAKIYEECTGKKLKINWGAKAYSKREVMIPWENGEKVPGWEPKFSLKDAICETVQRGMR